MKREVYIFGIKPGSKGEEQGYALPFWEPEPPEGSGVEDYLAWEERNPVWGLQDDLGYELDEEFVEHHPANTPQTRSYLASMLLDEDDLIEIKNELKNCAEIVLIFSQALPRPLDALCDTKGAFFVGKYDCKSSFKLLNKKG
jgi:hypothetical protein